MSNYEVMQKIENRTLHSNFRPCNVLRIV